MSDPIGRETTGEAATAAEARALAGLRAAPLPPLLLRLRGDELRAGDIVLRGGEPLIPDAAIRLTHTPIFNPLLEGAGQWFTGTNVDDDLARFYMGPQSQCVIIRAGARLPDGDVATAARAVVKAWADEGRVPSHHRWVRAHLWRSWPAMAQAVSGLVKASKSAGGR
jgi:hypothetical protein